ncbi:hypothetical protein HXA31_15895 [Salipaludibacillus agaradhaerens]|jgi:hypothetical protein|uniref:Uncharacterized protein n=1 Tax=Salipaludibacillus agaradhaerens TaxID=76935 RepID=A0A9Q4B6G2_SALAG|nr:hypothetical protein [Salipaludibacillus agaradhaerens]MCR6098847.1 hypothetical protein [Salipaludibacillus agaradhaerens]MCR6115854.1 hypothetical protein [Salipaludibacillus agaradhaerens]
MLNKRNYLNSPLNKEEMYLYHADENLIEIINDFKDNLTKHKDGCYLLGVMRGSGKSTFIRYCVRGAERVIGGNSVIPVYINLGNKINDLVTSSIRELYKVLVKGDLNISQEIITILKELYDLTFVQREEIFDNNKNKKNTETNYIDYSTDGSLSILSKLPFLKGKLGYKKLKGRKDINDYRVENLYKDRKIKKYDTDYLKMLFMELLIRINKENENTTLVFFLDDLDKLNTNDIESIINQNKDLILETYTSFVFIVSNETYISLNNMLFAKIEAYNNYFLEFYYVPLLSWDNNFETLCHRKLELDYLDDAVGIFYESNGLMRKAIHLSNKDKNNNINILCGFLYKDILNSILSHSYNMNEAIKDIIKVKMKHFIEYVKQVESISYSEAETFITQNCNDILDLHKNMILKVLIENCCNNKIIKYGYENISSSDTTFYLNESALINYSHANKTKLSTSKVEGGKPYHNYVYLKAEYIRVLTKNDNEGFKMLINLIERTKEDVLYILSVEKEFQAFGDNDVKSFSAAAVISEVAGDTVYIVEDCAFTYEGYNNWKFFKDSLKPLSNLRYKHFKVKGEEFKLETNFNQFIKYINQT